MSEIKKGPRHLGVDIGPPCAERDYRPAGAEGEAEHSLALALALCGRDFAGPLPPDVVRRGRAEAAAIAEQKAAARAKVANALEARRAAQ